MNHAVTALCVSENLYCLYDVIEALKVSGHNIVTACSYTRALVLAAAEKIDIIVIAETNPQEPVLYPANLKFVRPDVPILLVATLKHDVQVLPPGVDMRAGSVSEMEHSIRVLLAPRLEQSFQSA